MTDLLAALDRVLDSPDAEPLCLASPEDRRKLRELVEREVGAERDALRAVLKDARAVAEAAATCSDRPEKVRRDDAPGLDFMGGTALYIAEAATQLVDRIDAALAPTGLADWRARAKAAQAEVARLTALVDAWETEAHASAPEWAAEAQARVTAETAGVDTERPAWVGAAVERMDAEVARLRLLVKEACAVIDEAASETARNGRPISANVLRAHAADIRRHAERGVDATTEGEETTDV